ncbi:hypothetical protein [Dyadobacter diqingensis]|uniref:hypothetical protein n=1 Tax=Dyadobacter diqingensis TaxID=2938121 RepID=UPI0020C48B3D|nr:hypothetical protein [Dyadobacter diqingensis]
MEKNNLTGICGKCGSDDEVTEVFIDDESQGEACIKCCEEEGYCFGCGQYSGGFDEYEFSDIGPYCEQCQEQIKDAFGDEED